MKKLFHLSLVLLLTCNYSIAQQANTEFPNLEGPYFGQKPPNYIPVPFLPGVISSNRVPKHSPLVFSPDGTEAYWAIAGPMTIYYSKLENNQWTKPEMAPFAKGHECASVAFYPDGSKIFFTTQVFEKQPNQSNTHQDGASKGKRFIRLWYVERISNGWSEPKEADPTINLGDLGDQVSFTKDGTIYFTLADKSLPRENQNGDIYYSKLASGKYSKPVRLSDSINSTLNEGAVSIAKDESYILFHRQKSVKERPDKMEIDFFISYKKVDGTWTRAKDVSYLLGELASSYWIGTSPDDKYIFYTSKYFGRSTNIYWIDALSIVDFMIPYECIVSGKTEDAISRFKGVQKNDPEHWSIKESRFVSLGYNFLNKNSFNEAINIFKILTELYPQSYNAFDCLGEAYAKSENKELAIENYEKSLKLKPDSKSGIEALKKLKGNE